MLSSSFNFHSFIGLAGDLKKAMKDGKPIIIEVQLAL